METNIISLNKSALAEMPADVAAFVKSAAQNRRVRKALFYTVTEKARNMWADEGATITVFYGGQSARERMASAESVGGGDNCGIGYYSAPAGTWVVSERIFMGKWSLTITHVIPAAPVIAAPDDFEAQFSPVAEAPALVAPSAIVEAVAAPAMPAAVAEAIKALDPAMPVQLTEAPFGCVDLESEKGLTYFVSRANRANGQGGTWEDCAIPASYTMCPGVYEIPDDTWVIVQNLETGAYTARYAAPANWGE